MDRAEKRAGKWTAVGMVLAIVASTALVTVAPGAGAIGLPVKPTGVRADLYNWHTADVYWNPSLSDNMTASYKIEARNAATLAVIDTTTCAPRHCGHARLSNLLPATNTVFWVYGVTSLNVPGLPGQSSPAVTTPAMNTPDPPTGVTAVASATESTVTVSWAMAATGNAATSVKVVALLGDTFTEAASSVCLTPCTSSVALGLRPGTTYRFGVVAKNASGPGIISARSAAVTVGNGPCGSQPYCLTVDGTDTTGATRAPAAGLLHSAEDSFADEQGLLAPLGITSWRLRIQPDLNLTPYRNVVNAANVRGIRPTITLFISDAWHTETQQGGFAATPWSDWDRYDLFVRDYVRAVRDALDDANLPLPDYWEVQNEPDELPTSGAYFSAADRPSATITNVEQLHLQGHEAIKEVLPTAKLMGPSLARFAGYPGAHSAGTIDLSTFLEFSDANDLVWDAISWHENSTKAETDWTTDPEETYVNHMDAARALVAAHPAQGWPKLVVNEYGPQDRWVVPGWQAGAIAGFEGAGVDFASLACFSSANHPAPGHNCFDDPSTLNGLLATGGLDRYAGWWVHAFYSAMSYASGLATTTVRSTSSHPSVGVFATRNAANTAVYALVGRHSTCRQDLNADCQASFGVPPPVDIPLKVTLSYPAPNGVTVVAQRIPMQAGAPILAAPQTVIPTVIQNGVTVTITLPAVADGDALTVVVTPRP